MAPPPRPPARARTGAAGLLVLVALGAAGCKESRKPVVVLVAASLTRAFADLEERFERAHPKLDLQLEISGSQTACRKISELNRRADVVAVADHRLVPRLLMPRHASWVARFTTNAVVLAHMEHSRHTAQITADNWFEVLQRPRVRLGLVDPNLAPIGYRTLLVWQLAALELPDRAGGDLPRRLRARVAKEHVAPHESQLLQLLQTRAVDYAFVYRSSVEEHNLKFVRLPPSYNLGALDRAEAYGRASVKVKLGSREAPKSITGSPVVYGVTIPDDAPNPRGARALVAMLLGKTGQRTLARTGFSPIVPARCDQRAAMPAELRELTR